MYRIRIEIMSLDEDKAYGLCASYLNKKQGKEAILKGIDFVQGVCAIKAKNILTKLEGIPLFSLDTDYTRVKNTLVILYIAHKSEWSSYGNSS